MHANVSYVNSLLRFDFNLGNGESVKTLSSIDENNEYAQSCLDAVMEAVWKDDEHDDFCGGANSYKTTDDKVVFLTQAESNHHCSPAFAHYSQLEFECIVQLQEKVQLRKNQNSKTNLPKIVVINQDQVLIENKSSIVYISYWGDLNENVYANIGLAPPSKISW